jgi:barstar (barnase inhibitor)
MGKLGQRLNDASRSGVYRATKAVPVLDAARETHLDVARIDARQDVLQAIAEALGFPDWFGRNWDALEDCLGDLSWRPARGYVLVFEGFPRGDELGVLLDVLCSSAEFWAARSRPFFAVFIDPRRELALPDLFRGA